MGGGGGVAICVSLEVEEREGVRCTPCRGLTLSSRKSWDPARRARPFPLSTHLEAGLRGGSRSTGHRGPQTTKAGTGAADGKSRNPCEPLGSAIIRLKPWLHLCLVSSPGQVLTHPNLGPFFCKMGAEPSVHENYNGNSAWQAAPSICYLLEKMFKVHLNIAKLNDFKPLKRLL